MSPGTPTPFDLEMMAAALVLARRGLGATSPNPAVGAIVVAEGADGPRIVGRGWTAAGGRPHAETIALGRAGELARGATLYVTLEPCAHVGRTPPCADAVIAAGITRVVAAHGDVDPRVAGLGFARLRAAGVEVVTGVCAAEACWVNAGHLLRVGLGRPFVQLKVAVGADGRILAGDGRPRWVTGSAARDRGHLLRAGSDAILVGRGTLAADDPELTCRLPGLSDRSPLRVLLTGSGRFAATARMLHATERLATLIVTREGAELPGEVEGRVGVEVIRVRSGLAHGERSASVSIPDALAALAARSVTRLLVEGGPHVAAAFLAAGVVDEVVVFQGGHAAGDEGMLPFVEQGLEIVRDNAQWRRCQSRMLIDDTMTVYRSRASEANLARLVAAAGQESR
ncbi:MAG: bifunctional diaminohydroxyphosphoribosylaminopyrimidine deaminase/5-amino-6-(5-phosphoribosylamino)uracil reductase RibD [Hyphomicrobiaceae bacterium]